jgi:hypothetical protein
MSPKQSGSGWKVIHDMALFASYRSKAAFIPQHALKWNSLGLRPGSFMRQKLNASLQFDRLGPGTFTKIPGYQSLIA